VRAAVFSDVHGNLVALEAVLADATGAGAEECWIVGDLVAHGPQPAATIRRLMDLSDARIVRGNTDRYVLTGELPGMVPTADNARTPAEVRLLVDVSTAFGWTRGAVTTAGGYEWLASLPVEQRVTLPDGTRVLLVHAAPGHDDGRGAQPDMTEQELIAAGFADADAQLIFVGHTHVPVDYSVNDVRIVNLGSVSVPATAERRAMWTLLVADDDGFRIERHFTEYDPAIVTSAMDAEHHPSAAWLKSKFDR